MKLKRGNIYVPGVGPVNEKDFNESHYKALLERAKGADREAGGGSKYQDELHEKYVDAPKKAAPKKAK